MLKSEEKSHHSRVSFSFYICLFSSVYFFICIKNLLSSIISLTLFLGLSFSLSLSFFLAFYTFISLCLTHTLSLSASLFLSLSLSLSVSHTHFLSLPLSFSLSLSLSLTHTHFLCLTFSLFLILPLSRFLFLSLYFSCRCLFCAEAINCSAPDTGNMEIIGRFGTSEHRELWLLPLLLGETRSCFGESPILSYPILPHLIIFVTFTFTVFDTPVPYLIMLCFILIFTTSFLYLFPAFHSIFVTSPDSVLYC